MIFRGDVGAFLEVPGQRQIGDMGLFPKPPCVVLYRHFDRIAVMRLNSAAVDPIECGFDTAGAAIGEGQADAARRGEGNQVAVA
ncbi:hypothetical protein G6F59_016705 [Rhizopus arrhizus]|nr:hypothetical protein G6F59_016705 [Rhizopus arrhizus]